MTTDWSKNCISYCLQLCFIESANLSSLFCGLGNCMKQIFKGSKGARASSTSCQHQKEVRHFSFKIKTDIQTAAVTGEASLQFLDLKSSQSWLIRLNRITVIIHLAYSASSRASILWRKQKAQGQTFEGMLPFTLLWCHSFAAWKKPADAE